MKSIPKTEECQTAPEEPVGERPETSPGGPAEGLAKALQDAQPALRRLLASHHVTPEEGDELMQEATLILLEKLAEGHPIDSPAGYLLGTLRRLCRTRFRRWPRRHLVFLSEPALERSAKAAPGGFRALEARLDLHSLLQHLKPRPRSLLLCRFREGMTRDEAARATGYRTASVVKTNRRTLHKLREIALEGSI